MAEKYRILNRFDCFQQKEIQRGFSQNLDISVYAHPALSYSTMRQLRKGLEDGNDLTSYIDRGTNVLCELRKAMASGISLTPYVDEGYDGEQLLAIRHEIPLSAQIVSVADVYDALVSERVYKDAIPKDKAFRMIINGECGVFSPEIIECLKNCKKTLECA